MSDKADDLDRMLVEAVLARSRTRTQVERPGGAGKPKRRRRQQPRCAYWYSVGHIGDRRRTQVPERGLALRSGSETAVIDAERHEAEIAAIISTSRRSRYVLVSWAALLPGPTTNDADRVAVQLDGIEVGELPADEASNNLPALRRLWRADLVPICRADTYGGGYWEGFETWLYYGNLEAQTKYLDRFLSTVGPQVPPGQDDFSGAVYQRERPPRSPTPGARMTG